MRETYEIRLFTQYAPLIARETTIPREVPSVATILRGTVDDPQFKRVGELNEHLRKSKQGMAFAGWDIQRTYSKDELARARSFLLDVRFRHLAAEEYGTKYEEFEQCQHDVDSLEYAGGMEFRIVRRKIPCSIRARQVGALCFPYRKLGNARDIFRLWGGELVVSDRFVNLVQEHRFTGAKFSPTCDTARPGRSVRRKGEFAQLCVKSRPLSVTIDTRFGANPFDTQRTGYQHCEGGTIAGLRPISEASILGSSWDGSDFCETEIYVGGRGGLFRPHRLLIVSKKVLGALECNRLKGFRYEVVKINGKQAVSR
jgi:hypothetical protein